MLKPSDINKTKSENKIFGGSKAGRPPQSPTGEKRNKNINTTFTQSEINEIENYMNNHNLENKSSFIRKIVLDYVRNNK